MLNLWAVSTHVEAVIGVLLLLTLVSVYAEEDPKGDETRGLILNALTLGTGALSINVSSDGCVWRKGQAVVASAGISSASSSSSSSSSGEGDSCPDPAIKFYLYTSLGSPRREIDARNSASALTSAGWVQHHHTVLLIHGYGGGDNTIPITILRDAYLSRGDVNVIMVDWGALSPLPCYPAAVHNSAHVGRCAAVIPRMLRDAGANADAWTCVGHSLGAHICGAMAEYLSFRVHKIIGLDPARPLVRPSVRFRLDSSDAAVVHVIHTDAGYYGETGRLGTADFCVNGGRTQPHCKFATKGEHLCNHISSICFFAESLDPSASLTAEPCSRRCLAVRLRPGLDRDTIQQGGPIPMGPYSPDSATGTYCATSPHQPYCPRKPGDRGHPKCCIVSDNGVKAKPEAEPADAPGVVNDHAEPSPTTSATPTSSSEIVENLTRSLFAAESPIPTESMEAEPTPTIAMNRVGDDDGVVLVLPSTEIDLPSSTTPATNEEEPVFPVYSTVADTATGPVLVVMATPIRNTSMENTVDGLPTQIKPTKPPRPFSPHRSPFLTASPNSFPSSPSTLAISHPMFTVESSMTEMLPPKPTQSLPLPFAFPAEMPFSGGMPMQGGMPMPGGMPMQGGMSMPGEMPTPGGMPMPGRMPMPEGMPTPEGMPVPVTSLEAAAVVPMSPPPPHGGLPIPGAPDDGDAPIPMAGSLTGPWVPMVMLPPTPFSTDSWKIRSLSKMPPLRRSTFRNYIYE